MLKNAKHEQFAQAVALGASGASAYKKCISAGKCSDRTAEVNSSTLLRSGTDVSLRVAELRLQSAKKADMSRDEAIQMCVEILKAPPSAAGMDNPLCELKMSKVGPFAAFPDKSATMARLAKMLGWDEPEKYQLEVNVVLGGNAEGNSND